MDKCKNGNDRYHITVTLKRKSSEKVNSILRCWGLQVHRAIERKKVSRKSQIKEAIVIGKIVPSSPAHKAGLLKDDIIIQVFGAPFATPQQLYQIMKNCQEELKLTISRRVAIPQSQRKPSKNMEQKMQKMIDGPLNMQSNFHQSQEKKENVYQNESETQTALTGYCQQQNNHETADITQIEENFDRENIPPPEKVYETENKRVTANVHEGENKSLEQKYSSIYSSKRRKTIDLTNFDHKKIKNNVSEKTIDMVQSKQQEVEKTLDMTNCGNDSVVFSQSDNQGSESECEEKYYELDQYIDFIVERDGPKVQVRWTNGEETLEPLNQIAEDDPEGLFSFAKSCGKSSLINSML